MLVSVWQHFDATSWCLSGSVDRWGQTTSAHVVTPYERSSHAGGHGRAERAVA